MCIVTTTVHITRTFGAERQIVDLIHLQRINICTQGNDLAGLISLDLRNTARRLQTSVGNAHFVQLFTDEIGRAELFHTELRPTVDGTPAVLYEWLHF